MWVNFVAQIQLWARYSCGPDPVLHVYYKVAGSCGPLLGTTYSVVLNRFFAHLNLCINNFPLLKTHVKTKSWPEPHEAAVRHVSDDSICWTFTWTSVIKESTTGHESVMFNLQVILLIMSTESFEWNHRDQMIDRGHDLQRNVFLSFAEATGRSELLSAAHWSLTETLKETAD